MTTPTYREIETISEIARRAQAECFSQRALINIVMDISAVHMGDTPLRLHDLLNASKFEFAHDICGIANHLDRNTLKLTNHFLPRFAR